MAAARRWAVMVLVVRKAAGADRHPPPNFFFGPQQPPRRLVRRVDVARELTRAPVGTRLLPPVSRSLSFACASMRAMGGVALCALVGGAAHAAEHGIGRRFVARPRRWIERARRLGDWSEMAWRLTPHPEKSNKNDSRIRARRRAQDD